MTSVSHGSGIATRRWSRWLLAAALAVALGPAARGDDRNAARLQPEQIRLVQRALRQRGLHVEPTGTWDEPTRAALARFQTSKDLPGTGELDAATVEALGVNLNAFKPENRAMATWAPPDPMYNCEIYDTIDCGPGGGG